MIIRPILTDLNYISLEIEGNIYKINAIKPIIKPKFEYIATEYLEYFDVFEEHNIPCCYLEAFDPTDPKYNHLAKLPHFKAPVLRETAGYVPQFDPRRYFYNFDNEFDKLQDPTSQSVFAERENLSRLKTIIITDTKDFSGGGTSGAGVFYKKGRSLKEYFPLKIDFDFGNVHNVSSKDLSWYNYSYHLISDIVQGGYDDEVEEVSVRHQDQTFGVRRFKILDVPYTTQDDFWFDNHTALATEQQRQSSTKQSNFLAFSNQIKDIFDPSHVETLFVRIDKKDISGNLIQSFYIKTDENGRVKFSDTQVNIEKTYTYEYYSYTLLKIDNVPYLYEIPQDLTDIKLMQPPLPRPQVDFKNLHNQKNKIRIMLNLSSNKETSLTYYGINDNENENFIDNFDLFDPMALRDTYFNYETQKGEYEIYRMEKQPLSYLDVGANARLTTVEGSFGATMAHFTDTISAFKKYYYIIRCINIYRYASNPSPIYEVEMTKDANDTFLHVNTVGFYVPDQNNYMRTKSMAKLLQIIPSSYQTTVDPVAPDLSNITNPDELPDLGIVDKKIWDANTKFKIRLTSTKTGKKIDLNLKFKLIKNNSE